MQFSVTRDAMRGWAQMMGWYGATSKGPTAKGTATQTLSSLRRFKKHEV